MKIDIYNEKTTIHQRTFEDSSDFLKMAEARSEMSNNRASRKTGDYEWYGCRSFNEAADLLKDGWREGAELMKKWESYFNKIISEHTLNPEPTPDFHGEYFDIGLVLSGVPECWYKIPEVEQESKGKIVKIGVSIDASCAFTADDLIKRGAAALALIHAFELAGKSTEVTVCSQTSTGYGNGDLLQYLIPAKKAGEMLDLERVAFLTAHPGAFRRLAFSCMENEPKNIRDQFGVSDFGGYGYPAPPRGPDAKFDILVPEMLLGATEGDMIDWVLKQLAEQGIELRENV